MEASPNDTLNKVIFLGPLKTSGAKPAVHDVLRFRGPVLDLFCSAKGANREDTYFRRLLSFPFPNETGRLGGLDRSLSKYELPCFSRVLLAKHQFDKAARARLGESAV